MMTFRPDPERRRQLIDQLVGVFTANLAQFNTEQLEGILEAISSGGGNLAGTARGLRAPNNSAMLMINPGAGKDETVEGIRQLAHWLESHWEEVEENQRSKATMGFHVGDVESEEDDPKLLN